jgi:heat shock protein HslJ
VTVTSTRAAGALAIFVALAMTSCGESPTSPSDLTDRLWRLVAIEPATGTATVVTDSARYSLEFLNDSRVSARADCNTCSGSYSLSGESISIGPLACTRAFCGEASLDTIFTQGLSDARTATLDEGLLQLRGPAVTLKFRAQ